MTPVTGDGSEQPVAGREPAATDWAGVAFGLAVQVLAAYQHFKIPPVMPELLARYAYPPSLAGGFMAIYALIGLFASVPLGRALAVVGHRRAILAAVALVIAGAGPTLSWPDSGLAVLAGRGLEGAGAAALAILGPAIANAAASRRQLPLVAGLTALWIPIGQLAANGIALAALPRWAALWWAGIAAAVAVALWAVLRRPAPGGGRPAAPAAASAPRPAGLLLAAAIFTLWSAQFVAFMTWLPTYLVSVHRLDAAAAAVGYSLPVGLVLVFNLVGGVALRLGTGPPRLLLLSLAPQIAVWLMVPLTPGPGLGIVGLIAYGAGAGLTPAALFALPAFMLRGGTDTSVVFGWLMAGRNLGVLVGPLAPPLALALGGSWTLAGLGMAASTAAVAVLAARLGRRAGPAPAGR